jgi:phospholipase/carboxylesterase
VISLERPAHGAAQGAVVLVHGRGADEHDLLGLADRLDPEAHLHWYLPRGPLALPPGGAHWYAVARVGHPDPTSFAQGFAALAGFVDAVPYAHVAIGGFSQGAVMSFAVGLGRGRPRPRALIAFSGFIPEVEGWELDDEQPFPPIAIGHGRFDEVIPVSFAHDAVARLEAAGAAVLYRESLLGHAIAPSFLDELQPWLAAAFTAPGA